jgi:hypothetical protein
MWSCSYVFRLSCKIVLSVDATVLVCTAEGRSWPGGPGVRTPQGRSGGPLRFVQIRWEHLGLPPQSPQGELTTLPRPLSRRLEPLALELSAHVAPRLSGPLSHKHLATPLTVNTLKKKNGAVWVIEYTRSSATDWSFRTPWGTGTWKGRKQGHGDSSIIISGRAGPSQIRLRHSCADSLSTTKWSKLTLDPLIMSTRSPKCTKAINLKCQ